MTSSDSPAPCWPWMKDAKDRINNPIELIDQYDKRPAVKDLQEKHRADIDKLHAALSQDPLYEPSKHDDLWVLRFLLSQGKHEKALEAASNTLAFRQEHLLDEQDFRGVAVKASVLLTSTDLPPFALSGGKMLACYESDDSLTYSIPDLQRGVIGFLQVAERNQHKMAQALHETDYFQAHLFFTEWKFQWMDYLTRTTGRLTKYLSIADFKGTHQKMIHKESKKLDSAAAKRMEDKYPQLLGSMLICHAPKWWNVVFTLLKPFLPKRLLAKVCLIHPLKKQKDLDKILEYCSLEHLPERYGGTLEGWPPQSMVLPPE